MTTRHLMVLVLLIGCAGLASYGNHAEAMKLVIGF